MVTPRRQRINELLAQLKEDQEKCCRLADYIQSLYVEEYLEQHPVLQQRLRRSA